MAESFLWGLHPIELVEKILNIEEFGTVLDLGGGYGKNSLPFAQRGFDVTLVDFDSREINKLKKLIKDFGVTMKVFQENIAKFKFDRKYDIILNIATLHYLEEHEAKELIKKMKEGTAKGGLNYNLNDNHNIFANVGSFPSFSKAFVNNFCNSSSQSGVFCHVEMPAPKTKTNFFFLSSSDNISISWSFDIGFIFSFSEISLKES